MGFPSDLPPHRSAQPIDPPASPGEPRPNAAMLKGDIDAGRTGDKNEVFDPGLAMLGTDEEAAGTPPTAAEVRLAREQETRHRWRAGSPETSAAHDRNDDRGVPFGFIGLIVSIGAAIVAGVLWLG
jgi:hypothetical protein